MYGKVLPKNRLMIIQKIAGGLWNQMFQYAFARALSLEHGVKFKLDITGFKNYILHKYCLEVFDIKKFYADRKFIPRYENIYIKNKSIWYIRESFLKPLCIRYNHNHHIEKQYHFDRHLLDISSGYVDWYFQTEQYFVKYEKDIRKDFSFTLPPDSTNQDMIEKIDSCNSISIHIRRWDYISNTTTNRIHWTCDITYYEQAIQYITKKVKEPVFFFFSDDINRVKDNLKIQYEGYYIDFNNADKNYEDLRLMSICKHNIIANSSFSWWWAWLNKNKNKIVIAPQRWFNDNKRNYSDIIPYNRIKI